LARKMTDLAHDLSVGSLAEGREALFALLVKGGSAAGTLREIALAGPTRRRAVQILESAPSRTLAVLVEAKPSVASVVADLLGDASPGKMAAGWFGAMVGGDGGRPGEAVSRSLATTLIEWMPRIAAHPALGPAGAALSAGALALAHLLVGDVRCGLDMLRDSLRSPDLPGEARSTLAGVLGRTALAHGRRDDAMEAILTLAGGGVAGAGQLAELLAGLLLAQDPGADEEAALAALLELLADTTGDPEVVTGYLRAAWEHATASSAARASQRQGYFSLAIKHLAEASERVKEMLLEPDQLLRSSGRIADAAAAIARRLSELMSDLVAYQPLRYEPVEPRQLILEAATVWKDDLAQAGLQLTCAPLREGQELSAQDLSRLDPAMIRGVLRQLMRYLRAAAVAQLGPDLPPARVQLDAELDRQTQMDGDSDSGSGVAKAKATAFVVSLAWPAPGARQVLASAIGEGTIPDILGRIRATTAMSEPRPSEARLEIRFPAGEPSAVAGSAAPESAGERGKAGGSGGGGAEQLAAVLGAGGDAALQARLVLAAFWRLRQAELEAWGEDLALVLHDLKNSVAFVSGWLRHEDVYDWATIRERCLDNISDVQFWLSQAGGMLARSPDRSRPWVHLPELTRRVLRSLAASITGRRQQLVLEIDDNVPRVPAEPVWVASIVRNLAKNAIEATPDGGHLLVRVQHRAAAGAVAVELHDDGPGFPCEVLSGGDGPQSDGLGRPHLGLATIRRVLTEQGGKLELRNDDGGGATATALFDAGSGEGEIAARLGTWSALQDDTRRALTAARALLAAGDEDAASHLLGRALEFELASLVGGIPLSELAPYAIRLTESAGGRGGLSTLTRQALGQAAGEGGQARAEASARRMLSRVVGGKARLGELAADEVAAFLVLLHDSPALAPFGRREALAQLAASIWRASAALEAAPPRAQQAYGAVLGAIEGIAALSPQQLRPE